MERQLFNLLGTIISNLDLKIRWILVFLMVSRSHGSVQMRVAHVSVKDAFTLDRILLMTLAKKSKSLKICFTGNSILSTLKKENLWNVPPKTLDKILGLDKISNAFANQEWAINLITVQHKVVIASVPREMYSSPGDTEKAPRKLRIWSMLLRVITPLSR
jgi:hypothetical protein